jgi:homopolymeric O-antigen transport system ATP-binding protein
MMTELALRVEGIGKRYELGGPQASYQTLREKLVEWGTNPLAGLRKGRKSRPTFWALRGVSFEVQKGEVIGIIGRNGAGKSTLLKILSRITEPTEGGADIHGRIGSLLEVGTGFHPELSGRENVYLNGAILGMPRREIVRKFDEIVAFAEIEKFIDTAVKHYSSGMYMRLAFAVAAHLEPEILIVDEVLAVGDAAFQKKCLGKMGEVAQGGRTVLFVSHQMNAVKSLCTKALWLVDGQIMEFGETSRVLGRYLTQHGGDLEWVDTGNRPDLANPFFEPKRFALVDRDLVPITGTVGADEQVGILIEGDSQQEHSALTVGFAITASTGELMFWSLATDQDRARWPRYALSQNRLVAWLPQHFLNEGDYVVELIVSLHFIQWMSQPGKNAPQLRLSIRGGLSQSPFWMMARPGLNAPVLAFDKIPTTNSAERENRNG